MLAIVVVMALGYYRFILDWEGRPFCHKQFMLAFKTWMQDNGMDANSGKNPFPNVNGRGKDSLAAIREYMGDYMGWTNGYRYVPGLREDDPGELVLMYFDRPTRWTWHGPPATIFKKKAWIVVPVDFAMGSRRPSGPGELSERIPVGEFRSRLRRTIDFVRTNERPNWQTIVAEHTKFLESTEHVVGAQNFLTNSVGRAEAIKIASTLTIGMKEEDASKFLSRKGLKNAIALAAC